MTSYNQVNKQAIEHLFKTLQNIDPEPKTELNYQTPFELLIAVLLSAQSTDIGVNKVTARLFPVANTPQSFLDLGEENLKSYISSLGLFNSKARHAMQTARILVEQFNGQVPNTRKELESLPGVGRKTANVVLNVVFGEPTMAVDTHIFRVGNRTGLAKGNTPLDVEMALLKVIPDKYLIHAHHWLILHGRYTCTARKPKCFQCPINQQCNWPEKIIS